MQATYSDIIGIPKKIKGMFAQIAHRYDLTNTVLSLGIHHLWKKRLVSKLRYLQDKNGSRDLEITAPYVLDLCTGTGDILELIEKRSIACIGVDFCAEMIEQGKSRRVNGKSLNFMVADAVALPFKDETFDAVTVAFGIRNIPDLSKALNEIKRVLKSDGKLLILEFGKMEFPVLGFIYNNLYTRYLMPFIGGLLTGNMEAYKYLPETSKNFPSKEKFNLVLKDSGFNVGDYETLSFGIGYIYQATKKSATTKSKEEDQ